MGIFDGKTIIKSHMGGAVGSIRDGMITGLGAGVPALKEESDMLTSISGNPLYRIRDAADGGKEITDNMGQTQYRVSPDGSEIQNRYGQRLFTLE